jgi:hypothetical protein
MTDTWITDDHGNKCSIEYWSSAEAAQTALDSLKDCSDCSRCADCSDCSDLKNAEIVERGADISNLGPPPIPIIENIHQRVYAAASNPAAFDMGDWHTCSNTHCRAGWVVHLAGEAGYALERFHNTPLAAQLIYRVSGSPINPCRFYDNDEDALADMKRLAEKVTE